MLEAASNAQEAMANLKEIRKNLEAYGVNRTQTVNTQADMEKLLHLMGREKPETLWRSAELLRDHMFTDFIVQTNSEQVCWYTNRGP